MSCGLSRLRFYTGVVDSNAMEEAVWTELENIRVYFEFFKKHETN